MKLLLPRDTDIILGAGGIGRHHAGNKWFRRQLEPHKINYQQIEGRADKRTFLTSILQEISGIGRIKGELLTDGHRYLSPTST
jgi:hypothetical protein